MPLGAFLDNLHCLIKQTNKQKNTKLIFTSFIGEQIHRAPQVIMTVVQHLAIFISHLLKGLFYLKMPAVWECKGAWNGHWMLCPFMHCYITLTMGSNALSACKCPNYHKMWMLLDSRTTSMWLESATHIGMALHQWNTFQCLVDTSDSHRMAAESPCSPFVKNGQEEPGHLGGSVS